MATQQIQVISGKPGTFQHLRTMDTPRKECFEHFGTQKTLHWRSTKEYIIPLSSSLHLAFISVLRNSQPHNNSLRPPLLPRLAHHHDSQISHPRRPRRLLHLCLRRPPHYKHGQP